MIREPLVEKRVGADPHFRWRGREVTRLEGFSDAVFAFAITLLVVSLEVPRDFGELFASMRGFGAFAITFAVLVLIWYVHYIFFRRYALHDGFTVAVNSALLFVVLFYIYPLKFLMGFLIALLFGEVDPSMQFDHPGQMSVLLYVYSGGYAAVSLLYMLMYGHALRRADDLDLDEIERAITRLDILGMKSDVAIAGVSIATVFLLGPRPLSWAIGGSLYFLIGPVRYWIGVRTDRVVKSLAHDSDVGPSSDDSGTAGTPAA